MLSIARLAPTGAADYFLAEVATGPEAYYTGRGEAPGFWIGSLSADLGLAGTVDADQFRALLDGRHPQTGEALVHAPSRRPSRHHPGQEGWLSTSAVAERLRVSVRHVRRLIAGECLSADNAGSSSRPRWRVPASEVAKYQATQAPVRRRPGYDLTFRPPKSVSLLWALSPAHREAIRECHREAVAASLAYLEEVACLTRQGRHRERVPGAGFVAAAFDHRSSRAGDPLLHTHVVVANLTRSPAGKWRALDAKPLWWHSRVAGFAYQSHLRHLLTQRLGITWGPVHNGWANVVGIPQAVLDAFSKRRTAIEAEVERFGASSPRAYQAATLATREAKGEPEVGLHERWADEAQSLGFGPAEVARCFDRSPEHERPDEEELFNRLAGPSGLTAFASTFDRREVLCALSEAIDAPVDQLRETTDRFLISDRVLPLGVSGPGGPRFSTPELVRLEAELVGWATDHSRVGPTVGCEVIDEVLGRHPTLTTEQSGAVRAVASSPAVVRTVSGLPGSGKTAAMAVAVEAFGHAGVPVIGAALSATAAAELEEACRFDVLTGRPASTIATLLMTLTDEGLPPHCVVVLDEASMAPTRSLHRLASHIDEAGGTLILVGDPDQHGAVEAGGLFRHLVANGGATASLTANHRQRHALDRAAIESLRAGRVSEGLALLEGSGKVVTHPDAASARGAMVAQAAEGDAPMVAGSNRLRRQLNEAARERRREAGELGSDFLVIGGREFRVGDQVLARRNARWLAGPGGWVKNGSVGFVSSLDVSHRQLTVVFAKVGEVGLPTDYLAAGHLDHAYARTTYALQGATVESAAYQPTDASSFEEGYVALTRAREGTTVHLVDGALDPDDELDRLGAETEIIGRAEITSAMGTRRANTLAIDADPDALRLAEFVGWSMADLRAEAERLRRALDDRPPDSSASIARVERRLAGLQARASRPAGRRRAANLRTEVKEASAKLATLVAQSRAAEQWREEHAEEIGRLRLVNRVITFRRSVEPVPTHLSVDREIRRAERRIGGPELPFA